MIVRHGVISVEEERRHTGRAKYTFAKHLLLVYVKNDRRWIRDGNLKRIATYDWDGSK